MKDIQEIEAAVEKLLDETQGDPAADPREVLMRLRQIFDGMRAFGMPLPDDLVRLEQDLSAELGADEAE
jgi:hypothetical protein